MKLSCVYKKRYAVVYETGFYIYGTDEPEVEFFADSFFSHRELAEEFLRNIPAEKASNNMHVVRVNMQDLILQKE